MLYQELLSQIVWFKRTTGQLARGRVVKLKEGEKKATVSFVENGVAKAKDVYYVQINQLNKNLNLPPLSSPGAGAQGNQTGATRNGDDFLRTEIRIYFPILWDRVPKAFWNPKEGLKVLCEYRAQEELIFKNFPNRNNATKKA